MTNFKLMNCSFSRCAWCTLNIKSFQMKIDLFNKDLRVWHDKQFSPFAVIKY